MKLKDAAIRRTSAQAKPYKLADGGGLFLLVTPAGSKWWRLKYRIDGREKLLSLGVYPEVSLLEARERREAARKLLAAGVDPSAERKTDRLRRETAAANTFRVIADEWLALKADELAPGTHSKARWMLETFAFPKLGARALVSIEPPDVLAVLLELQKDDKLETMHRVKARISEVFRFAISTSRASTDPTRDLRGAVKAKKATKHHAALTDPKAIGELMRAIYGYSGSPEASAALRLAPMLFVRPGELRAAEWQQFELDSPAPAWRYLASKTKAQHIVPLPSQAVQILRELRPLTDIKSEARDDLPRFVFPSVRTRARPMSENTVNAALRRLGYTGDQVTGHGFRAMARTLLAEMGWKPDAIERQLAHKASGPLGAAYDRAQYLEERRKMMQAWADYLDQLRRGESKVVPIRGAA